MQPMKRPFPLISDLAGALPALRASDGFAERLFTYPLSFGEAAEFRGATGMGVAIARYMRRISRKIGCLKIRLLNKILAKNRLFCYMGAKFADKSIYQNPRENQVKNPVRKLKNFPPKCYVSKQDKALLRVLKGILKIIFSI